MIRNSLESWYIRRRERRGMAMDNRDLFSQFHIDASLFYDAIVNSTDDYIYLVDMQSDIRCV